MTGNGDGSKRLLDSLAWSRDQGVPEAVFATTFDLNPNFVESDFLPTVLGVSAWEGSASKGRLELEQQLALTDVVAIVMEGRRYQGRPASLRVHLTPASVPNAGVLHAKVCLTVHQDAVQLVVASANLTLDGYRHNREVAITIEANAKRPGEARLIAEALGPMREVLRHHWSEHAEKAVGAAEEKLKDWDKLAALQDDRFLWSGPGQRLWQTFLELWPQDERVADIHIVSPFWSPEGGSGPLVQFLEGLRERGASLRSTKVHLITAAERAGAMTYGPSLPASLAAYDFKSLGVEVRAAAATPSVGEEESRERTLHGKAVLVVGPKTSLAYVGSANFTYAGWGFGQARGTNIEAGVALRRRGKAREALLGILPATCGEVLLDGSASGVVDNVRETEEDENKPFPQFLRSVELGPVSGDASSIELVVSLHEGAHDAFTIELASEDEPGRTVLLNVPAVTEAERLTVPLSPDVLEGLLRQRFVRVVWPLGEDSVAADFPINVSVAVRENLPFAEPSLLPAESDLIAFYQGRIAFADAFPDPMADARPHSDAAAGMESNVDTSQILSYQIREFVEALPGLRQELERCVATPNTSRLGFLGPVSPVALAREIAKSGAKGRLSMAMGFQLVELLACLGAARLEGELSERQRTAWLAAKAEAMAKIRALYDAMKSADPALAENPSFRRYEETLLAGEGGVS